MLSIILIRPGSTDYDCQGRIQGNLDVPLNDKGSAEVTRLIETLGDRKMETVYAPPCQPAFQTAKAIAEAFQIKLKKLDGLRNLDQGLWQGMRVAEVRRRQPKVYRQWQETPEWICPPQGEMLADAEDRVRAHVTKLLKRHKEGVIGLVVPEPLARLVRRFLNQSELGDLWKASEDHGRWETLEVEAEALVHQS